MRRFAGICAGLFILISTAQAQLSDTLLPVVRNRKWGYINTQGQETIPCQYEAALYWGSGKYGKVKSQGKWYALTRMGQQLELPETGDLRLMNDSIWLRAETKGDLPIHFNGKTNFKEAPGAFIDARGLWFRFSNNGKIGLAHFERGIVIPAQYDALYWDDFPFIRTEECGFFGMCDSSGTCLLEPQYQNIQKRNKPLWAVWYGDAQHVGLFNAEKKAWIIPPEFDNLEGITDDFVLLARDEKRGIYFLNSQTWYPDWFSDIRLHGNTIYASKSKNAMGLLDAQGKCIVPFQYQSILPVLEVFVCNDSLGEHWFSKHGKPLFEGKGFQEHIRLETPNMLLKSVDNAYLLIDGQGKLLESDIVNPMVFRNRIKWYTDSGMRSLILNAKGQIEERNAYQNVVRLQIQSVQQQSRNGNRYDTANRNSPSETASQDGWYFDETARLYGLRNKEGQILIKPSFDLVYPISNTPYVVVYKKTPVLRDFRVESEYGQTGMFAGMVNGTNGTPMISCLYTDILVTGPSNNPVFFALETNGIFRHYLPNTREFGMGFVSVEPTDELPIRALVEAPMRRTKNSAEIICTYSLKGAIRNPAIRYHQNSDGLFRFHSPSAQYMYVWPNKEGARKYRNNQLFGKDPVVRVKDFRTGKWGLIDRNEVYVQEPQYNEIVTQYLPNGRATFTLKRSDTINTLVDVEGHRWGIPEAIEIRYTEERPILIKKASGWYIFDSLGITHKIDDVSEVRAFKNGRAAVKKRGYWTFITPSGTFIGNAEFGTVHDFQGDYTMVRRGRKWMRMNSWGNLDEPLPWRSMKPAGPLWIARDNQGYLVCDTEGKRIEGLPNIQHFAWDEESQTLLVRRANRYVWIDAEGKILHQGNRDNITLPGATWLAENGKRIQKLHSKSGFERKIKGKRFVTDIYGPNWIVRQNGNYILCDSLLHPRIAESFQKLQRKEAWYLGYRNGMYYVLDSAAQVVYQSSHAIRWYYGDWFGESDFTQGIILRNLRNGMQSTSTIVSVKAVRGHGFWITDKNGSSYLDEHLRPHFEKYYPDFQLSNGMAIVKEYQLTGLCDFRGSMAIGMHYPELKGMESARFVAGEYGDVIDWFRADGQRISSPNNPSFAQKPE
jgi:hypothetical protein